MDMSARLVPFCFVLSLVPSYVGAGAQNVAPLGFYFLPVFSSFNYPFALVFLPTAPGRISQVVSLAQGTLLHGDRRFWSLVSPCFLRNRALSRRSLDSLPYNTLVRFTVSSRRRFA